MKKSEFFLMKRLVLRCDDSQDSSELVLTKKDAEIYGELKQLEGEKYAYLVALNHTIMEEVRTTYSHRIMDVECRIAEISKVEGL